MPKQQRFPTTGELELEARLKSGDVSSPIRRLESDVAQPAEVYAPFAVEGNDTTDYVGVSPEYMTYASDTEKPSRAKAGALKEAEAVVLDNPTPVAAPKKTEVQHTAGGGSSQELVYTATSGEGYAAQQVVVEDSEPVTETAKTEENPGSPAATSTETKPGGTVEPDSTAKEKAGETQTPPAPPTPAK